MSAAANFIWTKHALQRLKERQFDQHEAASVLDCPDKIKPGKKNNTYEYIKKLGNKTVTLIVAANERGEKIVVSAWINPPLPGTKDYRQRERYLKYYRSGPLKKIWLIVKEQLGF